MPLSHPPLFAVSSLPPPAESSGRPFLLLSPSPLPSPSLMQQQQELLHALWVARVTQSTLVLPGRWRGREGEQRGEEMTSGDGSAWGLSRVYDMPAFIAQVCVARFLLGCVHLLTAPVAVGCLLRIHDFTAGLTA